MRDASQIRTLTAPNAEFFWKLRLKTLDCEPTAFPDFIENHKVRGIDGSRERIAGVAGDLVVGAFRDGVLVGSAGFHRDVGENVRHKGFIWNVYVTASVRRTGIAWQMLDSLINQVRTVEGVEQIYLNVAETQPAAQRRYESLGFHICGTEPRALKIGDLYVDEHLMFLQL